MVEAEYRTVEQAKSASRFPTFFLVVLFLSFAAYAAGSAYLIVKKDNQIEKYRRIELELQNQIKQRDMMIQQKEQHVEQLERRVEIIDAIKSLSRADLPEEDIRTIAHEIGEASEKYGHDPLLLVALMKTESSFQPAARSSVGARGLMQLMPITGRHLNNQIQKEPMLLGEEFEHVGNINYLGIEGNIQFGALYLAQMMVKYQSLDKALYAYNLGPNLLDERLKNGGTVPERYRKKVLNTFQKLKNQVKLKDAPLPSIDSDKSHLASVELAPSN